MKRSRDLLKSPDSAMSEGFSAHGATASRLPPPLGGAYARLESPPSAGAPHPPPKCVPPAFKAEEDEGGVRGALQHVIGPAARSADVKRVVARDSMAVFKVPYDVAKGLNLNRVAAILSDAVMPVAVGSLPRPSGDLCFKLVFFRERSKASRFLRDLRTEAETQLELSRRPNFCRVCGETPGSPIAPQLMLAGLCRAPLPFGCFYLMVMEFLPGESLSGYMRRFRVRENRMSPETYARLEKVVVSCWLRGFIHGDLHVQNVQQTAFGMGSVGSEFRLLDFGLSFPVPRRVAETFGRRFAEVVAHGNGESVSGLWVDLLKPYAVEGHVRRGHIFYHSDGRFLSVMRKMVADKGGIGAARRREWGCPASSQPQPQPSRVRVRVVPRPPPRSPLPAPSASFPKKTPLVLNYGNL